MSGARKPRLRLAARLSGPDTVQSAPSRKVGALVSYESAGQSGAPFADRLAASTSYGGRRPAQRAVQAQPAGHRLEDVLQEDPAVPVARAVRHASPAVGVSRPSSGSSRRMAPSSTRSRRRRRASGRGGRGCGGAAACRPFASVRSGSWLTLARGLPLPPWLTRSSRCAEKEYESVRRSTHAQARRLEARVGVVAPSGCAGRRPGCRRLRAAGRSACRRPAGRAGTQPRAAPWA